MVKNNCFTYFIKTAKNAENVVLSVSKILLNAMYSAKKPENFIKDFLIPGILAGRLDAAVSQKRLAYLREVPKFEGAAEISKIKFVNQAKPERYCYFSILRTQRRDPRKVSSGKEWSNPRAELFKNTHIVLSEEDWQEGVKLTGSVAFEHTGNKGRIPSVSHKLLIPKDLIAHWNPSINPKYPETYEVEIPANIFSRLQQLDEFSNAMSGYTFALDSFIGRNEPHQFAKNIERKGTIRTELSQDNPEANPLSIFLRENQKHHQLFRRLATATSISEIEELIRKQFDINGESVKIQAARIHYYLGTQTGRKAAEWIAEATQNKKS